MRQANAPGMAQSQRETVRARDPMAHPGTSTNPAQAGDIEQPAGPAWAAAVLGLGGFVVLTALMMAHVAFPFDGP